MLTFYKNSFWGWSSFDPKDNIVIPNEVFGVRNLSSNATKKITQRILRKTSAQAFGMALYGRNDDHRRLFQDLAGNKTFWITDPEPGVAPLPLRSGSSTVSE